jgi:3-oxoacyl-[acyl-carrier protein] reductase
MRLLRWRPTLYLGRYQAALDKRAQAVPLKRVVEPQDVALAIMACGRHMKTATASRFVINAGDQL